MAAASLVFDMDDGMETGGAGSGTNVDRWRRGNPNELLDFVWA